MLLFLLYSAWGMPICRLTTKDKVTVSMDWSTSWKRTVWLKWRESQAELRSTTHWTPPLTMESSSVCSSVNPKFLIKIVEKDPSPPVGIWILFIKQISKEDTQRANERRENRHDLNQYIKPDLGVLNRFKNMGLLKVPILDTSLIGTNSFNHEHSVCFWETFRTHWTVGHPP